MNKLAGVKKILVINLAFIGDVILATPTVRALKQAYPEAEIHMLVVPATAAVANGNPFVDRVFVYDKRGEHKKWGKLWQMIKRLRFEKYDLAVAMNFALRSSIMAWASGARYRLGYDAQHAAPFLTHVASSNRTDLRHESENHLALLQSIGIEARDTTLAFRLNPEAVRSFNTKVALASERPLVLICPFGRHPLNCWTTSGYVELLREMAKTVDCILIGGVAEKPRLEALNEAADGVAGVLAGVLTIEELAVLIDKADLMITVDTGPLHLAGAVGTPVLALFGRSDYRIWGPRRSGDVVLSKQPACWPCYQRECSHHQCMQQLQPQEVIGVALDMLKKGRNKQER